MGSPLPQLLCAYPALPPPIDVRLTVLPEHACPYLPGKIAQDRALLAEGMPAELYERFMDAGFRRSGKLLYQPVCRGCRACRQLRVPLNEFRPNKSQRRCLRRNTDLSVQIDSPCFTEEKWRLYQRYVRDWHGRPEEEEDDALKMFLYESPLETTLEFEYRNAGGELLAVGICDIGPAALSSVYLYFKPDESRRGLGTFAALYEIEFARKLQLSYYYPGFWITGCRSMEYKAAFGPSEILGEDGTWRPNEGLQAER